MTPPLKRIRRRRKTARESGGGLSGASRRVSPLARLAGDIWGLMFNAVLARKEHMAGVAAAHQLTLTQAHLLRLLQLGPARTMTSIAETLACDASNVTGIVDRLESRGLIVRGAAAHDRRIKTITLTPRGKDVVGELTAGFLEPPDELRRLSEPHLRRLHQLLQRAFVQWPGHQRSSVAASAHTSKAAAET